jgi:ABC-type glycerol-3-phosphate transport system substrate-binding protein
MFKKILAIALALCLLGGTALAEHTTLTFIVPSNSTYPNGFDQVLAKFEEETATTLEASLNFISPDLTTTAKKVSLKDCLARGD